MLNIEAQACGLAIDLVLIYFFIKHDRVGLFSERLFGISLFANTVCIILDIVSVFAIVYEEYYTPFWTSVICKSYLVFLLICSYMGFVYSYTDVIHLRKNNVFAYSHRILYTIAIILIYVLPIEWVCKEDQIFSLGPAVQCTYIFAPICIVSAILITITYRKQINPHRRKAVRAWMLIAIIAAGIQFAFPKLLLVGFGSSIGMMILYAELENPEVYLDRATGIFSISTLDRYITQCYESHKRFSMILICINEDLHADQDTMHRILVELSEFLHSFPSAKIFRGQGNHFDLVYRERAGNTQEIESALNLDVIRKRFEEPWAGSHYISPVFLYIKDSRIAETQEELSAICDYYKNEVTDEAKTIFLTAESGSHIKEVNSMICEIKKAIENDRVEVFYQPIYSIKEEKFVSAEALARLRDDTGNIIMPGRFIPVAEKYGMIEQIGERVFRKTCLALTDTNMRELGIRYVEVNLSIAQCENTKLASTYKRIMEDLSLEPNHINLEITESSALTKRNVMLENMNSLISLGCEFSLDDFGTGESNLNYIMDMPVQIVKFDRSMTQEYFKSDRAKIVMNATIRMIQELGLKIVAEGIETKDQLDTMAELGVDYIQGYYFSKPLPQNEFLGFIASTN